MNYEGTTSGRIGADAAPKRVGNEGIISGSLKTLRDSLDRLDGTLGDLRGRISPVLGPERPPGNIKEPSATQQTMSPLHDELENLDTRVNNLRRQVEELCTRVTL